MSAPPSLAMLGAVFVGGGVGSVLRYLVGVWLARPSDTFPWATLAVNIVGAFVLGVFVRALAAPTADPVLRAALTIGVCGGFTTFSTFSAELVSLAQDGRVARAALYAAVSVVGGVLATLGGLAVGAQFDARVT